METAFEYWYGDLLFLSDEKFILEDLRRESLLIYRHKIPFRSNTKLETDKKIYSHDINKKVILNRSHQLFHRMTHLFKGVWNCVPRIFRLLEVPKRKNSGTNTHSSNCRNVIVVNAQGNVQLCFLYCALWHNYVT